MTSMLIPTSRTARERAALRGGRLPAISASVLLVAAFVLPAQAATALADQPLFATPSVPGNLALLLSVEFPTAISVAHTNRTYAQASQYLGYFDPDKCYVYKYTDGTSVENYFEPSGAAASHACTTTSTAKRWSGNFLNWATMQTIDPFRWALTGGYRVIDETSRTVTEKAWGTGQGAPSNFPDSTLPSSAVAGATPFPASSGDLGMRVYGLGNKMRFGFRDNGPNAPSFNARYYNDQTRTNLAKARVDNSIDFDWGNGSPDPAVIDDFSADWTTTFSAPITGNYYFRIKGDDKISLEVDGTVLIDQTSYQSMAYQQPPAPSYGATYKAAGDPIKIVVKLVDTGGGAAAQLQWLRPGEFEWTTIGGPPSMAGSATAYNPSAAVVGGTAYEVFVRAKVCDTASTLEANCTAYDNGNYKPEGLLQKYANKIRYSAFGYLNDGNIYRDGGVLRARQKFVGPTQPVPGSAAVVNAAREWDAGTGVYVQNPDTADATSTAAIFGEINNSGVVNYLNKFGEITPGSYKTYDNVSELYYAAIRYFKALPDVPEWTAVGSADANTKRVWADGFPVITSPPDPILYSCQRNFFLGIGDVNTHADKNLPGRLANQNNPEPDLPAAVSADTSVDAVKVTDQIGALEGLGAIGSAATYNTPAIAGLAFDAHIKDIRPDDPTKSNSTGKQTIDTYWVDVQEGQVYKDNNQFYLATKYGGFTVPTGYESNPVALSESWWHTNANTLGANKRPDNYFSGGQPDLMKAGLEAAFAKIAAALGAYTTSFSTPLPQLAGTNNASYSAQYNPKTWTGEVAASRLSFDTNATSTTLVEEWKFTDRLATQLAATDGWDKSRFVLTWAGTAGTGVAFRNSGSSKIDSADMGNLDTSYVTGNDNNDYMNYLRGDKSNEVGGSGKKVYRARDKLVGDIVGSKLTPNGPPSFPFSDSFNPGYAAFKITWATRRTVLYFGANDGMMHAVNGAFALTSAATEKDANYGLEMFTYIPRTLFQGPTAKDTDGLASLGNPSFVHHYMVDATPLVYDVDFSRVPNNSGAKQNPAVGTYDWRSVLVGGLGKGGKAYYAIDVTDPVSMAVGTSGATEANSASKVLWEFSNATAGVTTSTGVKPLGFSYGAPLVMKTKKYGWVAMFTSGYNNDDGKGYFFFVNPKTGALLEMVSTNTGSPSNDAGLAQAEAFIVDATDGTADAIYAGDLLGNLWRLDVTGTTGTYADAGKLVKMAQLTDAANANPQPVTTRPAIEISPSTKKRYVMVGTGRLLDTTDIASTQGQSFYTFIDGANAAFNATPFPPNATPAYPIVRDQLTVNTDPLSKINFDPAPNAGWLEELGLDRGTPASTSPAAPAVPSTGIAYRIVIDPKAASGTVVFAATLPSGSVCTPSGTSDIYGRNYATAQTTLQGVNALIAYVSLSSVATDVGFASVDGKLRLLAGTDKGGGPQVIPIVSGTGTSLRRLNWRELQVVD